MARRSSAPRCTTTVSSMINSVTTIRKALDRWSYSFFGPTTVALKLEFFLVACLTLLTAANLQSVYKEDSFGRSGDIIYLLLVSAWLSRFLIFRWLCMWDPSTSSRPTLRGFLSVVCTAHLSSGQTFDRPSPQLVQKNFSTSRGDTTFFQLLAVSVQYGLQWLLVRVWYPIARTFSISAVDVSFLTVPQRVQKYFSFLHKIKQYMYSMWLRYGVTLSSMLPLLIFQVNVWLIYKRHFLAKDTTNPPAGLTTLSNFPSGQEESTSQAYGAYRKVETPEWSQVFFHLSVAGTMVSLVYYFRIMLPIPDQIAGGNVVKDLKSESSRSGKSSSKRSNVSEATWPERHRSITGANRFRLLFDVRAFRIMEAVFCCGILPRTQYICRATGHCHSGAKVMDLTKILYPIGVTSALREDGDAISVPMAVSRLTGLCMIVNVAIVTFLLLLAQTIVLSKTYLAMMAYVSLEWDPVSNADTTAPVWDTRRRYKKGDLVLYPPSGPDQQVYRATTNNPEGKPSDVMRRHQHLLFREELGHPSTSGQLRDTAFVQIGPVVLHVIAMVLWLLLGRSIDVIFLSFCAHVMAAYAISTAGAVDHGALNRLNDEITAGIQKK